MIQEYAGDPVPGGWSQAGGRAFYRSHDEIGPTAGAMSAAQLAGKIGGGWLTLAAEMAGLATGSWRPLSSPPLSSPPLSSSPSPDLAWPDPIWSDPPSSDPTAPDPARPAAASLPRVATRTLSADAGSVHAARDFTVATLRRWGTAERSQDIALVVSELLTNALRHALPGSGESRPRWPIRLGLLQPGSCVLCAVADPSPAAPVLQARGSLAETGRGLHLIYALSDQWGFTPSDTGKVVWAMFFPRLTVFAGPRAGGLNRLGGGTAAWLTGMGRDDHCGPRWYSCRSNPQPGRSVDRALISSRHRPRALAQRRRPRPGRGRRRG